MILALDRVQDPRNLGAICCTAEFAGVAAVVIPSAARPRSVPLPARLQRARSSTSRWPGSETLPIGWPKQRRRASGSGALTPRGSEHPWEIDLGGPAVIVLGGEANGIRPRVAAACDALIALPGRGKVGSLNVSAAAAALVFEAIRQR